MLFQRADDYWLFKFNHEKQRQLQSCLIHEENSNIWCSWVWSTRRRIYNIKNTENPSANVFLNLRWRLCYTETRHCRMSSPESHFHRDGWLLHTSQGSTAPWRRDMENVQRSVGNVPTDGAVRWIGVPAQLQYGCTVGDHHNPLPCPCSSSIILLVYTQMLQNWELPWAGIYKQQRSVSVWHKKFRFV